MTHKIISKYRTHTCAGLRAADVGKEVQLSGWLMRARDHGGVLFVDLRDHFGITQLVFNSPLSEKVALIRVESVIKIVGTVVAREPNAINSKHPSGEIEIAVTQFELLSNAKVLPFQVAEDNNDPEATRLKYRFIELRRDRLHKNIVLRSEVIAKSRELMREMGFTEFQTPILTSSSPEGARDFIVPSRLHPGKFYALPQAPQQFKQLLMVSGFDRYFQIAPCFRDEDARADRSPGEFYQIDFEMSFVEQEDVLLVLENLFTGLFAKFSTLASTPAPFPRIKYRDAIELYGSDKPDLRIPYVIQNVSEALANSEFKVFREVLANAGVVKALAVAVKEIPSRKYFDDLIAEFTKLNGTGLAYLIYQPGTEEVKGSVAKFFSTTELSAIRETCNLSKETESIVFMAAGADKQVASALGRLRLRLGKDFNSIEKDQWKFCFITDFPFYETDEETGKPAFSHNPFSMPQGGLEALLTQDPYSICAMQYDLVINGIEIASGGIRNHLPEIMYKAFELVGADKDFVDDKFGGMIRAFEFGAPPHGGAAPGVDRIVMLLAGEEMIRDVIAFPLAQNGEDLLMGAPSTVSARQLKDVHIGLSLPPAKNSD
jgi:aspartyl-tRNA synthetase